MKVQFREQTPGVRAGEWWDAVTGKHHSIVTIQSLDGWVAYIGDKRIGKEFIDHEQAAAFAIATLTQQSQRKRLTRMAMKALVPAAAITVLAFTIHSLFFTNPSSPPLASSTPTVTTTANAVTTSSTTTPSLVPEPKPTTKTSFSSTESKAAKRTSHVAATHKETAAQIGSTQTSGEEEDLPSIDVHRAETAPWEKSLSELAANAPDSASPRGNRTKISRSRQNAASTYHDADLEADLRADKLDRAVFLEEEPSEATVARATTESGNTKPESFDEPEAIDAIPPATSGITTGKKATQRRYKTTRKTVSRNTRRKARARRRSRAPLIRKVVRRNAFGQRYVVYKARRPRNNSEYRRLKRIKRRIAAQRRRYYRRKYGY